MFLYLYLDTKLHTVKIFANLYLDDMIDVKISIWMKYPDTFIWIVLLCNVFIIFVFFI